MRGAGDRRDALGYLAGSSRGFRYVAADLSSGCGLLFHRRCDRIGNIIHLADDLAHLANCLNRRLGIGLNGFDLFADVFGRPCRRFCQLLYFIGDHGETLSCFAGAG